MVDETINELHEALPETTKNESDNLPKVQESDNKPLDDSDHNDGGEKRKYIQEAVQKEIKRISKLDPSIKSFSDIINSENGSAITEKVKKGYSLYDAYLIANNKQIVGKVADAVRRTALNRVSSKEHLKGASSSKYAQPIEVPSATYALYKDICSGVTDEQIRSHYAKHNKK